MYFLIVVDVFTKYTIVRKLPNSSSAAVCIELSMIVIELGLPYIRSDNGPCYNSKEFQQFLQHYSITHQTSSPNHPRSNGFVKRMVGVAKKLMDKAGKEGKPWISGLFDYRVTLKEWTTESRSVKSNTPAIPYGIRDCSVESTQENTSSDTVQLPLPRLDLPVSEFSENREESQTAEPLCTDDTALETPDAQCTPYALGTRKSTRENFGKPAKSFSDFYL